MAKIYYDPNKDELIPCEEPQQLQYIRPRFHLHDGSGLSYLVQFLLIGVISALFIAAEAQFLYEWWMHMNLWGLWLVLMGVVGVIYGALMYAIVEPDYMILG